MLVRNKTNPKLLEHAVAATDKKMAKIWEKQATGDDRYLTYAAAPKKKRQALHQMSSNPKFFEVKTKEFNPSKKQKTQPSKRGGFASRGGRGGGRGGHAPTTYKPQKSVEKKKQKPKGTNNSPKSNDKEKRKSKKSKDFSNPREDINNQPSKVVFKVNQPDLTKITEAAQAQEKKLGTD